tara:strand:+ start:165 stop:818 length:654 start_codon:yes stop_codon:yes gene_type:complete
MDYKISIIICNTERSLEYLKTVSLIKKNIETLIYLDDKKSSLTSKNIKKNIKKINYKKIKIFYSKSINKIVSKYILNLQEKNFIFSNYPGEIVRDRKLLKNKNLIHFHTGKLPFYRGSTTNFYSYLKETKIYCDCLILNLNIDDGKILFQKNFVPKTNDKIFSNKFNDKIRAITLKLVLKNFLNLNSKKQLNKKHMYYIAHPVIRALALKKHVIKNK